MPLVSDLRARFRKNLKDSSHVDLAVAWALDCLDDARRKHGVSIRAIVGTYGNATQPDALATLHGIGKLRLVSGGGRLFHPKVYIWKGKRNVAWIGSANFTIGGFEKNVEAVFETNNLDTVSTWFKQQWSECGPLSPNAIADYRKRWARNPPSRLLAGLTGAAALRDIDRLEFLERALDWSGYMRAVEQCQDWWIDYWRERNGRRTWLVYRDRRSWMHTVDKGRSVAKKKDWSELSPSEVRILLGLPVNDSLESGLLGDMTRATMACKIFSQKRDVRRRIGKVVHQVVRAHADAFPDVAIEAIKEIKREEHFDIGIATRLLALARPDRIVSLNGGSRKQLKIAFPEAGGLSTPNRYGLLLSALYGKPWYDVAKPSDAFERKMWSMRAALLDCFVYIPSGPLLLR